MRVLRRRRKATALVAAVAATGLLSSACGGSLTGGGSDQAEVPSNVKLIVPFAPGGGTDTLARLLAPFLQKNVKGQPSFQVVNRPAGEGITGTNQFVQQNPDDGSQVLVSSATITTQWLVGRSQVKYDFTKLKPLMVFGTGGVIYSSKKSGITSVEDLKNPSEKLSFGGISATGNDLNMLLAFDMLNLHPKTTFGFEGRGPARLALERGETNIDFQTTAAYDTEVKPMVKEGKAVPLMTFGVLNSKGEVVRDPNFPDLPTVPEVYQKLYGKKPGSEISDAYVTYLAANFTYEKGLWATPQTPKSVQQAYIDSTKSLKQSKKFQQKREKVLGHYPIYSGDKVQKNLSKAYHVSPSVDKYVTDMLKNDYDTTID